MRITFFGSIWIVITVFLFFSRDIKNIIAFALYSMIFQCNNILFIGATGIGVQIFVVTFTVIKILMFKLSSEMISIPKILHHRKSHYEITARPFWFLFLIVLLSVALNDVLRQTAIALVMIFVYILFAALLITYEFYFDESWLTNLENTITITLIFVGFLQCLAKLGVFSLTSILRILIYNDINNPNVIFNYKGVKQFYSTLMEPSYCGALLVGLFTLYILKERVTVKNILYLFFITICILLTQSSTAYLGLVVIVLVLCVTKGQKKFFKFCLPLGILFALFFCLTSTSVLKKVIFDKAATGSYRVRAVLNRRAIENFISSPLYGVGYRCSRASSLLVTLLGELGILGAVSYFSLFIYYLRFYRNTVNVMARRHSLCVAGIIICQLIACPDLNFSPFWLAVYLQILAWKLEKKYIARQ